MSEAHSDALVFFSATGGLAYKKVFPALQARVRRGHLDSPVIGVAKAGWNLDQLLERAKDHAEKHQREDYVEEEWRIVDPALKADTPVHAHDPGTWGPKEVDEELSPREGWANPVVSVGKP